MTQPIANCPNCGAKIVFRWSSSVQTVCQFCKSILVRTDVHLKKVGQVADLPPDNSPLQVNTEGQYGHQAFVVVGRILYEYDQGGWNEWHVMMNDGTSAWLSDAQSEYALSRSSKSQNLPTLAMVHVGQQFTWSNQRYTVSVIIAASKANCRFSIGTRRRSPSLICARNPENSLPSITAIPNRRCISASSWNSTTLN